MFYFSTGFNFYLKKVSDNWYDVKTSNCFKERLNI